MPPIYLSFLPTRPWLPPFLAAIVMIVVAGVVYRIGAVVLTRMTHGTPVLRGIVEGMRPAARFVLPLLGLQLVWQACPAALPGLGSVRHLNGVLFIGALTWLVMGAISGAARGLTGKYATSTSDNLNARRIQTQTEVLARTLMGIVFIVGVSIALMTFPAVRQVGASLLASAGVVGLVAGIAARSVLGNLIAGLQIALAQPIRIDDVLVIQGEWGRVEEITGTYVVLRIWDMRRLIIPLQWLIENPFQNWTRTSATVIGTVFLWVDYRTPVEPLRSEARRLCDASTEWDRDLCKLEVTEVNERAMQVRLIVTTPDSSRGWDLRCRLREGLIDFLQREYPECLPMNRAEVRGEGLLARAPELGQGPG